MGCDLASLLVRRYSRDGLRKTAASGGNVSITDGPFAETKEQLLGFYLVDCDSKEEAVEIAHDLAGAATHGTGAYELRPLMIFKPTPEAQ